MNEVLTPFAALVGLIGIPALVTIAIGKWLISTSTTAITEKLKAAIKAEYDEKLETLKASLKASGDADLERHKHALALEAARENVRFSRLHEIRAEVIGNVYAALAKTYDALRAYTAPFESAGGPSKDERLTAVGNALREFRDAFISKKVFLPKKISDQLDHIHQEMFSAQASFFWGVHFPQPSAAQTQKWVEISGKVDGSVKGALEELEAEMRGLMGDAGPEISQAQKTST